MLGTSEILLILGAILLLFGGKKLPEFAKNLGKGIREFKRACNGEDSSDEVACVIIKKEDDESERSK